MNRLHQATLSLLLATSLFSGASSADWGSFLDDIGDAASGLFSEGTTSDAISSSLGLDTNTIISGLKEALDTGTRLAIDNVSKADGYLANELIRIAMPPELKQASDLMRQFGLSAQADQFEQSMNHAAEKAAPEATNIIISAIKDMTIEDANAILQGNDDAATQYFKDKTTTQLTELFRPTITDSLNQVGTTKYYNDLAGQVAAIPLVGENINLDLSAYVTEQALNGLFAMIAIEEKKIRDNPAARTTELLKQVFTK
ncbi:MAG: DUF4197 domain-containing protein [Piscirickettsiaceae bacterium]|nr:DUF4197 domain-containing protein [Piscirickettsiaceae bacterium]